MQAILPVFAVGVLFDMDVLVVLLVLAKNSDTIFSVAGHLVLRARPDVFTDVCGV
jgi:hypothetical protein